MMLFFVRLSPRPRDHDTVKMASSSFPPRTRQRRHLVTLRSHSGIPHQRDNRLSVAARAR